MAPTFVVPLLAILPAAAVLLIDLARFEGYFQHEKMFFALMLGLVLGFVVAVLEALFITSSGGAFVLLVAPLVEMMALIIVAGVPRFRNQRAAVWYGAAAGLGLAAVVVLGQAQRDIEGVATGLRLVNFAIAAAGWTLLLYAAGLIAGWGSVHNRMLVTLPAGYLMMLPASFARLELDQGGTAPFNGATLWAALILLYGAGAAWGVARKAHELGKDPEVRKKFRREMRRASDRDE